MGANPQHRNSEKCQIVIKPKTTTTNTFDTYRKSASYTNRD